jgi:signal transduction histidine kinase/CheY-like chemotaxis protein
MEEPGTMQPRVLFVDDEPRVTKALKRALREEPYTILTASSAREALQLLAHEPVDLVVADERMPGMPGSELLAWVCRTYPDTVRILLTGHASLETAVRAINEGGISRFLTKPCKEGELIFAIQQALQQKKRGTGQMLEALVGVGWEMTAALATPALLGRLCQLTTKVLGCDCSHTFLWQPQEGVYLPVAGSGYTPEQWEAFRVGAVPRARAASLLSQLTYGHAAQVVTAAHQDLPSAGLPVPDGLTVCLYLALRRGGEFWGIHAAGYRGRRRLFTPQQEWLARGMVHIASLALENARLVAELERASHCREEFLGTMSHELRTPLSVITGYTQLLLEGEFGPLTAEQAAISRKVEQNSHALLELIDALLTLNRLEVGQLAVERRDIDLSELIGEVEAETRALLGKPGLSAVWQVASDLPQLRTDPLKLKAVVTELLRNAVKFTDQGRVTVDVHPGNGGVDICVADTGIGIAPEAVPGIFELFRQADGSTTRRHGGVGLGLYLVRRLLELLGGTVTVESEVGYGSTFRLSIPTGRGQ